ncbi:MAG: hypothetical protein NXI32_24450 [bacterium]|nr:hypothetical protein [bacterium]
MADQADVRSVEQLELLDERTSDFRARLLGEIENLQIELHRLTEWIESDASGYWREELNRANRAFVEARENLSRCMSYVREEERRPCTEEKKRVQRAKDRKQLCEEKLQIAKNAAVAWERARRLSQTHVQRCRDLADADLNAAQVHLRGQIERLREYLGLRSAANSPANKSANPVSAPEKADPDSKAVG